MQDLDPGGHVVKHPPMDAEIGREDPRHEEDEWECEEDRVRANRVLEDLCPVLGAEVSCSAHLSHSDEDQSDKI